jgi:death-on-curing protein
MKTISTAQILALHRELINNFGGTDGLRDECLLDSAISAPFHVFEGKHIFPSIEEKATRLGFGLIKNHPFLDGNKRIGAHAMLVFLALNGVNLSYTQKELYETILQIAEGTYTYENLLRWVWKHRLLT